MDTKEKEKTARKFALFGERDGYATEVAFATQAELDAYMQGSWQSYGFNEVSFHDTEEDLRGYATSQGHGSANEPLETFDPESD